MPRNPNDTPEERARLAMQAEMERRLADLMRNPPMFIGALMGLMVEMIAREFPVQLTPADTQTIYDNYPHATPEMISRRAMSAYGVETVADFALHLMRIALDYNGKSNVSAMVLSDRASSQLEMGIDLQLAYDVGINNGLSPYGVTMLMLINGVQNGQAYGLNSLQLLRAIADTSQIVMQPSLPFDGVDPDAALFNQLLRSLGIMSQEADPPRQRGPRKKRGG